MGGIPPPKSVNSPPSTFDEDSSSSSPTPPHKAPRRRASMNSMRNSSGSDLESPPYSYNNKISNLNYETLKMISSQAPAKIRGIPPQSLASSSVPLRWSQFAVDDRKPLAHGSQYAFLRARWTDSGSEVVLLLEETLPKKSEHFLHAFVEVWTWFEDAVPAELLPWESSSFINSSYTVKVSVTVLPPCLIQKVTDFVCNSRISPEKKYFALLQSMNHWLKEPDFNQLLVFLSTSGEDEGDYADLSRSSPSDSVLYVTQHPSCPSKRSSFSAEWSPFEIAVKGVLITGLLGGRDHEKERETLLRRISGSCEEVQAQLRLFCQLRLFGPRTGSEDLSRIWRHRSERAIKQWVEGEVAGAMKEAVQRTIQRNNEPITPLKRAYVEFLMMAEISAKNILDFLVDLL